MVAGVPVALRLTNRAHYRAASLPGGVPSRKRLKDPKTFVAAICEWAWALLPKETAAKYDTPEDLVEDLDLENVPAVVDAVLAAFGEEEAPAGKKGARGKNV